VSYDRPDFDDWGLLVALAVSVRGDCRRKLVGAVITDTQRRVVSTGYNGSPPGGASCLAGACPRAFTDAPSGSSYDTGPGACISLHAEQNALLYGDPARMPGATIYVTCEPCQGCAKMITGVGIARTVWGLPSAYATRMTLDLLLPDGAS
jgi:dCMP deaminase